MCLELRLDSSNLKITALQYKTRPKLMMVGKHINMICVATNQPQLTRKLLNS